MNDKIFLEKAIKYLNRLLQMKPLKSPKEIKEVKGRWVTEKIYIKILVKVN